jgi:hypothetical protein
MPNGSVLAIDEPFGTRSEVAISNGRVWIGKSNTHVIHGYDRSGRISTIIRSQQDLIPVTAAIRSEYKARDLLFPSNQSDDVRRLKRTLHLSLEFPRYLPTNNGLIVDLDGNAWVQQYRLPWEEPRRQQWLIHTGSGTVATFVMPTDLLSKCQFEFTVSPCKPILDIGAKYLLIVVRDSYDVARVVKYELLKS